MQYEQYTRTKGPTIVEDDFSRDGRNSPVKYRSRGKRKRGYTPDYLPTWQWALMMRMIEMVGSPQNIVVDHLHSRRKSKWHTPAVVVVTLIVTPIVLRAIPVVIEFYLSR